MSLTAVRQDTVDVLESSIFTWRIIFLRTRYSRFQRKGLKRLEKTQNKTKNPNVKHTVYQNLALIQQYTELINIC